MDSCATDRALEQKIQRRDGTKKRLCATEQAAEELRERAKKEAAEHATKLGERKAAFVELTFAKRHLEADLVCASRTRRRPS